MKNIIAAIDFSNNSDNVLDSASEIAKGLGAKLWIIHATSAESSAPRGALESYEYYGIVQQFSNFPFDVEKDRKLTAEKFKKELQALNSISAKFNADGIETTSLLLEGAPVDVITEKAAELECDLIVLGSHGHGELRKLLVGSTCEEVLREASCGVLIVPPKNDSK